MKGQSQMPLKKNKSLLYVGSVFDKLTVIEPMVFINGQRFYKIKCSCNRGEKLMRERLIVQRGNCGCSRIKHPLINGEKYGELGIKCFSHYDNKQAIYTVICRCGKEFNVSRHSIVTKGTTHCGCVPLSVIRNQIKPNKHSCKNSIYAQYRLKAKIRNFDFQLSFQEFLSFIVRPCYYCGVLESNTHKNTHAKEIYKYNGIDRLDSNKGYILDNCVPCCKNCNKAKLGMTDLNFLEWVERVYKFSIESKNEQST